MVEPIPQLYEVTELYKLLHRRFFLPKSCVGGIVRGLKYLRNPAQSVDRKSAAQSIETDHPFIAGLEADGYREFAADNDEVFDAALTAALRRYEEDRENGSLEKKRNAANKHYLINVLRDSEFLRHPDIFRFIISRGLVDRATGYFGSVPILSSARLWWSPVSNTLTGSQMYHLDEEDSRQLKLFINILPCSEKNGPLNVIPAEESRRLREALGHSRGRLADEAVASAGPRVAPFKLIGPAGAGAWVDTSRCLHYGSRGGSVDRLVLMVQFTHHLAPMLDTARWDCDIDPLLEDLDSHQMLALGIR